MVKKQLASSFCEKEKQQRRYENKKYVSGHEYERVRAHRIKENMEKLRQLGIEVKIGPTKKTLTKKKKPTTVYPSMPKRTSSRLAKKPFMPISDQVPLAGKDKICRNEEKLKVEEVYTSEHEKLLGDCKSPWLPSFDADHIINSKRHYDSVDGITCHQCRQKTLGLRTGCNLCHLPHGRLCGNCLHIRYGENLQEAKENTSWTCPVCRGICNCSRCRALKGWPPTGSIHNEAWKLGFKSVAHYLIYTRLAK